MDSNFSPKVKEIISYSREEALRLGNDFIGTEHLLLGLIREGDGMAVRVLQSMQTAQSTMAIGETTTNLGLAC